MKHETTSYRLRKALNDNNMTAQALSDASGIGKASISQYVNGSHKPSNISSAKMANVLNVNPLWLMGFDVPMVIKTENITVDDALLDAKFSNDSEFKECARIYYSLPEEKRAEIRRYISFVSQNLS